MTVTVQLANGAIDVQLFVCEKSLALAPMMVIPVIDKELVPGFEMVRVCAELLEPMSWLPKLNEGAERLACGKIPKPPRATL